MIVLSRPILCSGRYNDDLILSTFFHELVHCYLIICCGEAATQDGGHTSGFHKIAKLIDDWVHVDRSRLGLDKIKADLDHFQTPPLTGDEAHECEADMSRSGLHYHHRCGAYDELHNDAAVVFR